LDAQFAVSFQTKTSDAHPRGECPSQIASGSRGSAWRLRLFADLELAHGDGRFTRLFRQLVKADLLILDDWGSERLTASQRCDLMEIVEDRYATGSTVITSPLPVETWHDVIDEPTCAHAILDRLIHNAHRLPLDGPSLRKTNANSDATAES
jgi:DNA replication protein DnaC